MPPLRHPLLLLSLSLPFLSSFSRLFARTNSPANIPAETGGRPYAPLPRVKCAPNGENLSFSLESPPRFAIFFIIYHADTLLTFRLVYSFYRSFGRDLLNYSTIWIDRRTSCVPFSGLFFWEAIRERSEHIAARISLQIWRRSINILSPDPCFGVIKIYRIVHHSTFSHRRAKRRGSSSRNLNLNFRDGGSPFSPPCTKWNGRNNVIEMRLINIAKRDLAAVAETGRTLSVPDPSTDEPLALLSFLYAALQMHLRPNHETARNRPRSSPAPPIPQLLAWFSRYCQHCCAGNRLFMQWYSSEVRDKGPHCETAARVK